jgi:hypothetical protein
MPQDKNPGAIVWILSTRLDRMILLQILGVGTGVIFFPALNDVPM